MSMHTRAFGEMHFLIYGQDPLVPMKLEQAFAQARPADEIRFDSFENYDQAYDFAKENKNVGLVFMLENCGEMSLTSVLTQLSKQTELQNVCFGILLHNGEESFKGLRAMKDNNQFIAYYDVNDLLDPDKTQFLLEEIWSKYQEALEKTVIPVALAQTYRSIALLHQGEEDINFTQRLCTLLSSEMNLTWQEGFALRWFPVLRILENDERSLLQANKQLMSFYEIIKPSIKFNSLLEIANSEIGVAQKVASATTLVSDSARSGQLEQFLSKELKEVSPRSKALLRILKRHQQRILEFSNYSSNQNSSRILKVV